MRLTIGRIGGHRWPAFALAALLGIGGRAEGAEAPPPASSDAGNTLDLASAIRLAREHNPQLLGSEAGAEAAAAARREAQRSRLPVLTARERALRTDSPADAFGLQLMQERFSFPAFTMSDPNDPEPIDNFTTELELRLPVFTGGALSAGIRQAGEMAAAASAIRDHTARAVDLAVTEAYHGALLAERFRALAEQAHATTARHVEQAQAFFDTGMIVESDLLQARVQLARMEENRVRARGGAQLAQAGLNRAMGVELSRAHALVEPGPAPSPPVETLEAALAQALANRADLRAADRQAAALAAGVTRARAEYFPQIGVAARYDWNDDRAFGTAGDSYLLVAQAEWNLWNWGQTRARVARSQGEHRAAREAQRERAAQVEFEVRQAWQALDEARQRCAVTASAVAAAERALAILEERFAQGVARLTDLLDAETLAHEQRVRDAQARFDLAIAVRLLSFSIGDEPVAEVTR